MIPVLQDNRGGRGNCMAACWASILEIAIEEVPDYRAVEGAGGSWMNCVNTWLTKHYNVVYFELEEYFTRHVLPAGWHLINYGDHTGGHSVVGWQGTPIWDPMGQFIGNGFEHYFKEPFNYGILVRQDKMLRNTWAPTWRECLCSPCMKGN